MKQEQRFFNRFFILVWICGAAQQLCQCILNAYTPIFVTGLGYSTSFGGMLGLCFAAAAIVARIFSGYFVDRYSRRWAMVIGCLLLGASGFLFGAIPTMGLLILFRCLFGVGFSLGQSGAATANVDTTPEKYRTLGIGIFWTATAIGQGTTGYAVEILGGSGDMAIFYAIALLGGIGVVGALLCRYEHSGPYAVDRTRVKGTKFILKADRFLERRALRPALVVLVVCTASSAVFGFAAMFAEQCDYPAGPFFLTLAAGMTATNLFSDKLSRRFGGARCLAVFNVLCGVMLAAMALFLSPVTYYLAAACYGAAFGINLPLLASLAVEGVPQDRRGAANSTVLLATDVGIGVGSLLWGVVVEFAGFSVTYVGAGVGFLAAALMAPLFSRKKRVAVKYL